MADDPQNLPPQSGPPPQSRPPEEGPQAETGIPTPAWERAEEAQETTERSATPDDSFREQLGPKQARKLLRRKEGEQSIWFGLGMFGVIGWSVVLPGMIGLGLGYWIDRTWSGRVSWTLTLMVIGICLGSVNAWYWVQRQRRAIEERERELQEQERLLEEQQKRHPGQRPGQGPGGGKQEP